MNDKTKDLTMGSLFDGIGGFPLSASRYGIQTLWASEIEKFPIQVTKVHFPEMVHVGDMETCWAFSLTAPSGRRKEKKMAQQLFEHKRIAQWENAVARGLGDQFSVAWRVLDAQYWGAPQSVFSCAYGTIHLIAQRRARIFLVADFAGHAAPKILFEQDCLLGDFTPSQSEGKTVADSVENCPDDTSRN